MDNYEFPIAMLKRLASESQGNVFYSPLSLSMAMGMTYAGSGGATKEQIARVFHFPLQDDTMHTALGNSLMRINSLGGNGVEIRMVNQLWADSQYEFLKPYLKGVEAAYHAPVKTMPFRMKPSQSREEINKWVANRTNGRIEDLLPNDAITSLTALILTNAVYFSAPWANRFDPDATTQDTFYPSPQRQLQCSMMHRSGKYNLHVGCSFQTLELPYAGNKFSMVIILPNEGVLLQGVVDSLTPTGLGYMLDNLVQADVNISLPRFKLLHEYNMRKTLTEMGMPIAFSDEADFTRMSAASDLKISNVFHKAFVEVSEEGTEAAAATAVVIMRKSAAIPHDFIVNRPFIFLIREMETGIILFMGRVVEV